MIPFLSLKDVTALHGAEINEAVNRVVNGGWYLQGKENERFEENYSQFIGAKYTVGCANGLDALIWIFRAYLEMGVMQRGDEVIVPANTYIATILAITENGLKPILVEPKLNTLEIDDDRIEEVITPRTKAITIVHLYGRIAYTEKIGELCKRYHLKLVEDCAQSHGCLYSDGRMTGNIGDAAGHSFYPGKNLGALGDGGVDLQVHPRFLRHFRRAQGPFIRVGNAAEGVMGGLMRPVQAQGHALNPRLLQGMEVRMQQPGGSGGAQCHMQPLAGRRADQFQNVRPHDGVPARQHQHGRAQLRQLVNQAQGFLMGQFIRMGPRLGYGAAMLARQRAGARHFPENQEGAFIEICFTKNRSHSSGQPL